MTASALAQDHATSAAPEVAAVALAAAAEAVPEHTHCPVRDTLLEHSLKPSACTCFTSNYMHVMHTVIRSRGTPWHNIAHQISVIKLAAYHSIQMPHLTTMGNRFSKADMHTVLQCEPIVHVFT